MYGSHFAWLYRFHWAKDCLLEDAANGIALLDEELAVHDFGANWDRFHVAACEVSSDDGEPGRVCKQGKEWGKNQVVSSAESGSLLKMPFLVCMQGEEGEVALAWAELKIPTSGLKDLCFGRSYHFGPADAFGRDVAGRIFAGRQRVVECPKEMRDEALKEQRKHPAVAWTEPWAGPSGGSAPEVQEPKGATDLLHQATGRMGRAVAAADGSLNRTTGYQLSSGGGVSSNDASCAAETHHAGSRGCSVRQRLVDLPAEMHWQAASTDGSSGDGQRVTKPPRVGHSFHVDPALGE